MGLQELFDGDEGAGVVVAKVATGTIEVYDAVFDDEIAVDADDVGIGVHVAQDGFFAVVAIVDDEDGFVLAECLHFFDDRGRCGVAGEADDAVVCRLKVGAVSVYGEDDAVVEDVEQVGKVEGASSITTAYFDDDIWFDFVEDFLVYPGVQRVFDGAYAHPVALVEGDSVLMVLRPLAQGHGKAAVVVAA